MTYPHKLPPLAHQARIFEETKDLQAHALLWEQGTGKTKTAIDTAAHLFMAGKLRAVVVLAPKAVAPNWVLDELPDHLPDEVAKRSRVFLWETEGAGGKGYQRRLDEFLTARGDGDEYDLRWLVMSYSAIMTQRQKGGPRGLRKGKEAAKELLLQCAGRSLMVLDESTRIKSPGIKLTKRVLAAGEYAAYRRIMSGTPVDNSPFDVYAQLKFLDPTYWAGLGCTSFESFKTTFGEWIEQVRGDTGQRYPMLVGYKNLPSLHEHVARISSRVLKSDVLDLPAKIYTKRYFELSAEQSAAYQALKNDFMAELDRGEVTAPLAITRLIRFQQIVSGYVPTDDGQLVDFPTNPRLQCLLEELENVEGQGIIWAKFHRDIDLIAEALTERGEPFVVYDGRRSQAEREAARAAFKSGEAVWFVANPAAAGEGLTLTEAKTVLYYNNSFKLKDRLQSEDRAHRIGQDCSVRYVDIVARGTVDVRIVRALRDKVDLAAQVTGDKLRAWI